MAEGRTYMKGLCIILNILLGIFGVILFLYGIVTNSVKYEPLEDGSQSVLFSVGFGLATILLAILGVYGAYQQQLMALLLYCIFMTIEFIALITLAIIAIVAQPQVDKAIEDSFGKVIPLHNADGVFQRELNKLQQEAECCGLKNYTDWNNHMPPSCNCPSDYPDKKAKCHYVQSNTEWMSKADSELMTPWDTWGGSYYVYKMTCGPILMAYVRNVMRILLGIIFTLATIKIAAVIVALLLWHKIGTTLPITGTSRDDDRIKYELQPDKIL